MTYSKEYHHFYKVFTKNANLTGDAAPSMQMPAMPIYYSSNLLYRLLAPSSGTPPPSFLHLLLDVKPYTSTTREATAARAPNESLLAPYLITTTDQLEEKETDLLKHEITTSPSSTKQTAITSNRRRLPKMRAAQGSRALWLDGERVD